MALTRRDFLKVSTVGGAAASVLGFDLTPAYAEMRALKIGRADEKGYRKVSLNILGV